MVPTIRQRVAKGAMLLDEHKPGWYMRTNLDHLDMGHGWHCILGQEYAGDARITFEHVPYWVGLRDLASLMGVGGYGGDLDIDFGFDTAYEREDDGEREYRLLQVAWVQEITRRRNAHVRDTALAAASARGAVGSERDIAEHATRGA